ncbi:MAG: cytochrome c peroxidase [Pseudohongiellaceae bacterium]
MISRTVIGLTGLLLSFASAAQQDTDLRDRADSLFGSIDPVTQAERDNPVVRLGRALFWDTRLSYDGETACASCHLREDHGSDSRTRSITARGEETGLHSMTIFNTQTAGAGLRWFADRESGQAQAIGSITGSMGFEQREDLLDALREHGYGEQFAEAFPDADETPNAGQYGEALEAYQRSLRTPAPFDDWLRGNDSAMTGPQKAGLQHFMDLGCAACHNGELLGGDSLQKFGMVGDYWEYTGSPEPHEGLMATTGDESDRHVFRVSPLRNVAGTAPYFHDASVETLDEAVRVMSQVQLGRALDEETTRELVSFLEALTGELPGHFSAPGAE